MNTPISRYGRRGAIALTGTAAALAMALAGCSADPEKPKPSASASAAAVSDGGGAPTASESATIDPTEGQESALNEATSLANRNENRYSEQGVRDMLSGRTHNYSESEVEYAMAHVQADWYENAAHRAQKLQGDGKTTEQIRSTLVDQEKFTEDQADAAVGALR